MDAQDRDEKLKDLEKSLAEELDVAAPAPSVFDPASQNNIMVNPTLITKIDPPEEKTKKRKRRKGEGDSDSESADDIALDQLDELLASNDPAFTSELETIRKELVNEDVKIADGAEVVSTAPETLSMDLDEKPTLKKWYLRNPLTLLKLAVEGGFELSRKGVKSVIHLVIEVVRGSARTLLQLLKGLTLRQALLLLAFSLLVGGMGYLWVRGERLLEFRTRDFIGSFAELADAEFTADEDEKFRKFNDPDDAFNFVVEYARLIVNLKPSLNSTHNPMATFVLFFEGSSRETAIELKDREKAIRDLASRLAEEMTYDDFIAIDGKNRYKVILRKEINNLLNTGRLRSVMFSTFLIKP